MEVRCPECGEDSELKGRREGEVIHMACSACGHAWVRDPWRCPTCGERMTAVRKPLLQKARGTQQSIVGYRTVKACPDCDSDQLEDGGKGSMSAT